METDYARRKILKRIEQLAVPKYDLYIIVFV